MRKIYILEERSCQPTSSQRLVELLSRWYGTSADVQAFDVANSTGLVPLPAALFFDLQERGSDVLPALVVDGIVKERGALPTFDEAIGLIEGETTVNAAPLTRSSLQCCPPSGGSSCC